MGRPKLGFLRNPKPHPAKGTAFNTQGDAQNWRILWLDRVLVKYINQCCIYKKFKLYTEIDIDYSFFT